MIRLKHSTGMGTLTCSCLRRVLAVGGRTTFWIALSKGRSNQFIPTDTLGGSGCPGAGVDLLVADGRFERGFLVDARRIETAAKKAGVEGQSGS